MEKEKDSKAKDQKDSEQQPLSLSRTFVFSSFLASKKKVGDQKSYKDEIKPFGTFNTVEGFWSYYRHINRPDKLPERTEINLFQENIQPMWEDEANKGGGRYCLRVKALYAGKFWEDLLIGFIGEQCSDGDCINGIVLSVRGAEILIFLWIKQSYEEERNSIEAWIRSTLGLSEGADIEYKPHPRGGAERYDRNPKPHKTIERNEEAPKHRFISDK